MAIDGMIKYKKLQYDSNMSIWMWILDENILPSNQEKFQNKLNVLMVL